MAADKKIIFATKDITEQIISKMDLRPQYWLANGIEMSTSELSKKLNGISNWEEDELKKIQSFLKFKIKKESVQYL